jgi:hypothetical protein
MFDLVYDNKSSATRAPEPLNGHLVSWDLLVLRADIEKPCQLCNVNSYTVGSRMGQCTRCSLCFCYRCIIEHRDEGHEVITKRCTAAPLEEAEVPGIMMIDAPTSPVAPESPAGIIILDSPHAPLSPESLELNEDTAACDVPLTMSSSPVSRAGKWKAPGDDTPSKDDNKAAGDDSASDTGYSEYSEGSVSSSISLAGAWKDPNGTESDAYPQGLRWV